MSHSNDKQLMMGGAIKVHSEVCNYAWLLKAATAQIIAMLLYTTGII